MFRLESVVVLTPLPPQSEQRDVFCINMCILSLWIHSPGALSLVRLGDRIGTSLACSLAADHGLNRTF